MNHENWDVLGIAPTEDRALIRQAYARMAKKNHPEDDPEGFRHLRQAYEWAIKQTRRETSSDTKVGFKSPEPTPALSPLENTFCSAAETFTHFWRHAKNGADSKPIDALEVWWFHPSRTLVSQKQFNRLLLDAVLDEGMPRPMLNQLVWRIYWRSERLHFPVETSSQRHHAFRQRLLQAVQKSLWEIRLEFATSVAKGQAELGLKTLQNLFASSEFDHLEKRQMLRVILLRFIAGNPHIPREVLAKLNDLFQFSAFCNHMSETDLVAIHALGKSLSIKDQTEY